IDELHCCQAAAQIQSAGKTALGLRDYPRPKRGRKHSRYLSAHSTNGDRHGTGFCRRPFARQHLCCHRKSHSRSPGTPLPIAPTKGVGKGDAVRLGFARAKGDILMILDADLTVPPEDLPRFYEALVSGKGEFINGVRLVYPMEKQAMRFL